MSPYAEVGSFVAKVESPESMTMGPAGQFAVRSSISSRSTSKSPIGGKKEPWTECEIHFVVF